MLKEQLEDVYVEALEARRNTSIANAKKHLNLDDSIDFKKYVEENYDDVLDMVSEIIEEIHKKADQGSPTTLSEEDYKTVHEFFILHKSKNFLEDENLKSLFGVKLPAEWLSTTLYLTYNNQKDMMIKLNNFKKSMKKKPSYKGRLRSSK